MSTATPFNTGSALAALQHACQRRSMAEIELEAAGGLISARMRLLACDDQHLSIDRPVQDGIPLELTTDTPAAIYFLHEGERYVVRSRIAEETRVDLGDGQTAPGFILPLTEQVLRQERRGDCRASLARCGEVIAHFEPLPGGANGPGGPFRGQLMNISAGGLNAVVLDPNGNPLEVGDVMIARFELPPLQRCFELRIEIRHRRRLDSGAFILGMKYLADDSATEMRHAIRQISQFVAKQLKKRSKPAGDDLVRR